MKVSFTVVLSLVSFFESARAVRLTPFLADPQDQVLFENEVPNALDPSFIYKLVKPKQSNAKQVTVIMCNTTQETGLRVMVEGNVRGATELVKVSTPVWGYGPTGGQCYWPGPTFEVQRDEKLRVEWINDLTHQLLTGAGDFDGESVIDTSIHWAMSLDGCNKSEENPEGEPCGGMEALLQYGIPVVPHLHGGHTASGFDGNPEFFFTPELTKRGPQFKSNIYLYDNDQPAGTLWYHDHALGITRLNVYAGLAGFYIIRDNKDTGKEDNPLTLPAGEFELALAIQDRMFKNNGELFYPAFEGDPFYADFIDGEEAELPNKGPTVLAEFFGDFMVVNGMIWPKKTVKPQEYRLRLLNGCDSRFLVIQFVEVDPYSTNPEDCPTDSPNPPECLKKFWVVGTDQGLSKEAKEMDTLVFEPGARYDIVIDFDGLAGKRVIMKNLGYDSPFGSEFGDCNEEDCFPDRLTDRIMAFDVEGSPTKPSSFKPNKINFGNKINVNGQLARTRQLSLFEGKDNFNRLLPVLGLAETGQKHDGTGIEWEEDFAQHEWTEDLTQHGLTGLIQGSLAWHNIITENPCLGDVEIWEIYNPTGDSHPVHLHLVTFEVLGRYSIVWHNPGESEGNVLTEDPESPEGTYLLEQRIVMHDGKLGWGFALKNPTYGEPVDDMYPEVVNDGLRDMVVAFPGTVTRIAMKWDRPGRYVWHCHILSHEDSEMMRPLFVHQCDKV